MKFKKRCYSKFKNSTNLSQLRGGTLFLRRQTIPEGERVEGQLRYTQLSLSTDMERSHAIRVLL